MKKTVIMVWCKTDSGTHANGSIKTYGLGDLLRGTIYLHQQSLHFGFNFIVDIRMHPISKCLIVRNHDYMNYVNQNLNKLKIVNCHESDKFNLIYNAYNASVRNVDEQPLLICTNMFCNDQLTLECKQFMKTLLSPNENFTNYINQQNSLHGISAPYSILHIRLSDDEFSKDKMNTYSIANATRIVKEYSGPSDILVTNSFRLKEHMKSIQHGITMFNTRPMHLGELSTIFSENVSDSFKETLYEFFSLSNASNIKTYSVYEWVSGFVKFVSIIYDVPLRDLRRPPPKIESTQVQLKPQVQVQLKPQVQVQLKPQVQVQLKPQVQVQVQLKPHPPVKLFNRGTLFKMPMMKL